jgi:hypothetical protein
MAMTTAEQGGPAPRAGTGAAGIHLEFGGLRFDVSCGQLGVTLRVSGDVNGKQKELLRFDDFADRPQYRVPADGITTMFDRAALGVPLDWYIEQLRDHLGDLLTIAGYAKVASEVDLQAVTDHVEEIRQAMTDILPYYLIRVPDVGLQFDEKDVHEVHLDFGGLSFAVSCREPGVTLRVSGEVDGQRTEFVRFDDFAQYPHYHVPSDSTNIPFDRATLGVPLDWYIEQLRDNLGEFLTVAGFAKVLSEVDLHAVADHVEEIRQAMIDIVPEGRFVRVPNIGLQEVGDTLGS